MSIRILPTQQKLTRKRSLFETPFGGDVSPLRLLPPSAVGETRQGTKVRKYPTSCQGEFKSLYGILIDRIESARPKSTKRVFVKPHKSGADAPSALRGHAASDVAIMLQAGRLQVVRPDCLFFGGAARAQRFFFFFSKLRDALRGAKRRRRHRETSMLVFTVSGHPLKRYSSRHSKLSGGKTPWMPSDGA